MKKRKFKTSKIKRTISVVFVLALLLTVFPISSASSKSVAEFSFNYAYDCSRSPAFPKAGDSFVASNLQNPLVAFEESGTTTHGNWKLTSKGLFTGNDSDYKGANYCEWCECIELKTVVDSIASIYNISTDKVEVFELTESNNHIAYGVLCALSNSVAAFIGDTWDGGAGYVLGVEELSDPYTTTIELDLTTGFNDDSALDDAKNEAKKAIAEVADPYSAYRIFMAAENAKKNVDAQTTIEGVAKAKEDGIQAVKDAIYAQELADVKEDAITGVGFYSGVYLSANAKNIVNNAEKKINNAKTVEEVQKIVADTKKTLDTQNKKDNPILIDSGLKVTTSSKGITAKWGKASGADGYIIYGAYCGQSVLKSVKTISNPKVTTITFNKLNGKKLNTNKDVKLYVAAYKDIYGKKVMYGRSILAHIAGSGSKTYTNAKSISLNKTSVKLDVKKTFTIKATVNKANNKKSLLKSKHVAKCRYKSSNTKVATVSANGKITAKAKGVCAVYVYAQNGCTKKLTVTVK